MARARGKGGAAAAVIGALIGRGLSVSDIAAGAGFHINTVSKWGRGEGKARPQNIARLRRLLAGGAVDLSAVALSDLITEIGARGFNVVITSK